MAGRTTWLVATAVAGLVLAIGARAPRSDAAFTGATPTGGSTFSAAADFPCASPGSTTLTPVADTDVYEGSPSSNYGTDTELWVRPSSTGTLNHSFVRFVLPSLANGCEFTAATLRLRTTVLSSGRTIAITRVATAWDEATVTWTTHPGQTGTPVTAPAASGWVSWDVLSHVLIMETGPDHGFLVRDANELSGSGINRYSSREGAAPPELILTWG